MKSKSWSVRAQAVRRKAMYATIRNALRPLLDNHARSERLVWWDQKRVALGATNAFFTGDRVDIAFANTIMRYVRDDLVAGHVPDQPAPFETSYMAGILMQHRSKLEADILPWALEWFRAAVPYGMTADYQFHGYNDNMPVMWTWALAAAAELFGEKEFYDIAWANLQQLRDLLHRRGAVAEYGQNYSTHRLTGIAHCASLLKDRSLRTLAKKLEARLWAEIAGHWSPVVGQICGASMRGGCAFNTETSFLLEQVFGDKILNAVMRNTDFYDDVSTHMITSLGLDTQKYLFAYVYGYAAEFAAAEYHVPDQIAKLFFKKPNGFEMQCTTENNMHNSRVFCKQEFIKGIGGVSSNVRFSDELVVINPLPEHAGQEHFLTTYHGKSYAVGTSTTNQFTTSHAFRCTYRRKVNPESVADIGDIFVRYNINDKQHGPQRLTNRYWMSPEHYKDMATYHGLYQDMGRQHCLQHKNSLLCLQIPKDDEYWKIRSMRTDIFFHMKTRKLPGIYVGKTKIKTLPFMVETEDLVTLNEGGVYIAIRPLICRHGHRKQAMKIWQDGEYLVLSLYNYDGPKTEMTSYEIVKYGNGFAFEIRDADEVKSFTAFQHEFASAITLDKLYASERRVHYVRDDLRLSMFVCPYSDTVMYRAINGLTPLMPRFHLSDNSHKGLPFLDEKTVPARDDLKWIQIQMNRTPETYNPVE